MVVKALNFQHFWDVEAALIQVLIFTLSLHKFFISCNDIWKALEIFSKACSYTFSINNEFYSWTYPKCKLEAFEGKLF